MKRQLSLLLVLMLVFTAMFSLPMVSSAEGEASTTEIVKNRIDILTFNDFHGAVAEETKGKNPGMAKLVAYVNQLKAANPNTIIVSGGDMYQGTAMSNLTVGAPVTEMLKMLDIKASAVGNHEFDWGAELIGKWGQEGEFPFIASNIYDKKTNQPVTWAKPYIIEEVNGVKIAFIGLAHVDTPSLTKSEYVKDLEFKNAVESAKTWVDFLKAGKAPEGTPDVIIALTHLDSDQNSETKEITGNAADLAKAVDGIDAIVSAHSHRIVSGKVNDVSIVQGYYNGRTLGILSINLDEKGKVVDVTEKVDNLYKNKDAVTPDAAALAVFDKYNKELAPILGEKLGTASGEFTHNRENPNMSVLGQWVTEIMAKKGNVQIALQNGGGLRRTLNAGDITMGDMYEILPFDNTLVTFELSGADIKKAVDHGIMNPDITDGSFYGVKVEFDPSAEFENRITKITLLDGTPLEMDKFYTVCTNDFQFGGGDKYDFSRAKNVVNTYIPVRDILVDTIKAAGTINPMPVTVIKEAVAVKEEVKVEVKSSKYKVVDGDVLWKIAKKYGVTYQELAKMNNLKNPNLIITGQELLVPAQ